MKVVIALAIVALAVPALAASAAEETAALALRAERLSPLTLRGSGFAARESVRLTVTAEGRRIVRSLRATRFGGFRAQVESVQIVDRCNSDVRATARGARSGTASWKLPQLQCPPAP